MEFEVTIDNVMRELDNRMIAYEQDSVWIVAVRCQEVGSVSMEFEVEYRYPDDGEVLTEYLYF